MKEMYKKHGAFIFFSALATSAWNGWWWFLLYFIFTEILAKMESPKKPIEPEVFSERVSDFEKAQVKEAQIPLIDVISISKEAPTLEAIDAIKKNGLSRILVYEDQPDNIIGILNIHDLLGSSKKEKNISSFIKEPVFIPEAVQLKKLLVKMQKEGVSLCVVLDEFNQVSGIITLEDILEELVGEISDEHDKPYSLYKKISASSYLISSRMEIDDINEKFNWNLPKKDYESLGGFLMNSMNCIPQVGRKFKYENLTFSIQTSTKRSIKLIHVKKN